MRDDLAERLEALETEYEVLSARFDMLTDFLMNAIALLAEDEGRETLRIAIQGQITAARQSGRYDIMDGHNTTIFPACNLAAIGQNLPLIRPMALRIF